MPRTKNIKKPDKISQDKITPALDVLSKADIATLKKNHPLIPKNFDLFDALVDVHDMYLLISSHKTGKSKQKDIQESLQKISTYSEWLAELMDNLSSVKNKSIKQLLLSNGCRLINDRKQMKDLAVKVHELSNAAKKAHNNNIGTRTTKNVGRDYVFIELAILWRTATGKKTTISVTAGSRINNIQPGSINTTFGKFLKDTLLLFGYKFQSDTALMQAYRVATKK